MNKIKNFNILTVPVYKMVFMATSDHAYEMSRTILVEDYPEHKDYTVVKGYHCSCYGFDATEWEAVTYTVDELRLLVKGWLISSYDLHDSEGIIAPLILRYIGEAPKK